MINDEVDSLRSQNAISKVSRGGRRYSPRAFTEQGVAMLSSVLRSERAVQVNVAIMRAFVRLRRLMLDHEELARKITAVERKYDAQGGFRRHSRAHEACTVVQAPYRLPVRRRLNPT